MSIPVCPHCCATLINGICPDPNCAMHWKMSKGFTLIELLITMLIVGSFGILMIMAYSKLIESGVCHP